MKWIKKLLKKPTKKSNAEIVADRFNSNMAEIRKAGSFEGRHYTETVETVKRLKRERKHQKAISILLKAIEATEAECKFAGDDWGVAPWYYEQLAIIYRKEKLFLEEVNILERYEKQPKAPGVSPEKLAGRLVKAKQLLAKNQQ